MVLCKCRKDAIPILANNKDTGICIIDLGPRILLYTSLEVGKLSDTYSESVF
jgi:hypothetical protein